MFTHFCEHFIHFIVIQQYIFDNIRVHIIGKHIFIEVGNCYMDISTYASIYIYIVSDIRVN